MTSISGKLSGRSLRSGALSSSCTSGGKGGKVPLIGRGHEGGDRALASAALVETARQPRRFLFPWRRRAGATAVSLEADVVTSSALVLCTLANSRANEKMKADWELSPFAWILVSSSCRPGFCKN